MEIKLSFIIPVYNVERYLRECVDSILRQMTEECEIILVDDGATDSSGQICDEYAARYCNVIAVHKENGGLSSARNCGLDIASGQYVAFVDSDDKITYGSISYILSWADDTGVDICFMEGVKLYADGKMEPIGDGICRDEIENKPKEYVLRHLSTRPKFSGSACTKLFRKDFLVSNELRFPKDRRHSEDLGFCLDCILVAKTYDYLPCPYYEYRQNREGSITSRVTAKSFWDLNRFIVESVEKLTVDHKPNDCVSRCAMGFVAYEYSIWLWHYSQLPQSEKAKAKCALEKYQWILRYAGNKKVKLIGGLSSVVGIEKTSQVLGWYMKRRG